MEITWRVISGRREGSRGGVDSRADRLECKPVSHVHGSLGPPPGEREKE